MEFINNVHLRGYVGMVRELTVDGRASYRFSVMTDYCYRSNQGAVVETTWHDVSFRTRQGENLDWLRKGAIVEVKGRLRRQSYVLTSGEERPMYMVVAESVEPIKED